MPPLLALYARTFVIGIAVAAPVGAMGMLCIQRTLQRGWRIGLATGMGIATADGTYAALAAFGVAAISSAIVAWQTPLRLVGGAVLVYLGVQSMRAKAAACDAGETGDGARPPSTPAAARDVGPAGPLGTYVSAVGLTLTNPMTIMAFGAVFASAGLVAQPGLATAATATLGIASGSLSWWIALVAGVSVARVAAGPTLVSRVRQISGAVIVAFGVLAVFSAVWPLVTR